MTDCPDAEVRDLLPDLLHGQLAPAERARVELHVATCANCRAELTLLAQLRARIARVPAVDIEAVARALPAYRAQKAGGAGRSWQAAAAVVAITLGATTLLVSRRAPVTSFDGPAAQSIATTTAAVPPAPGVLAQAGESAAAGAHVLSPARRSSPLVQAGAHSLSVEGVVGDLSDGELQALLTGLGSLRALPPSSVDADNASLAPASARGAL